MGWNKFGPKEQRVNMSVNYAEPLERRAIRQYWHASYFNHLSNFTEAHFCQIEDWGCLDWFLILGFKGDNFYAVERDLQKNKHEAIVRCIKTDGVRAVKRILEISDRSHAGR